MADTSYLDWPFLDDGHRALAADIRSWAEREIGPIAEALAAVAETIRREGAGRVLICGSLYLVGSVLALSD